MYLRGEIGENPPGNVIVSLSLSILREAGAGIETVSSGFADRGLTTWLPRRIRLPDLIRWLSIVFFWSRVANCCQFFKTFRISPHVRARIANSPVQRKQGIQVLSGRLQSQRQAKA